MQVNKCDMCGKELPGFPECKINITKMGLFSYIYSPVKSYDLCKDCLTKVKDFIENNGVKDNEKE